MDTFSSFTQSTQPISIAPENTAILVVDMLHDFCDPTGAMCLPGAEKLYPIQNNLIKIARTSGMMIGWIVDAHRQGLRRDRELLKRAPHCFEGTNGVDVMKQLDKKDDDLIFIKRRYSAFFGTDLDLTLRDNLIDTLIVFGVVTNICVRSTVHDAFFNGYQVVVPKDACAATGPREQESSLYDIATHFGVVTESQDLLDHLTGEGPLKIWEPEE
jgi:ureidoacrylate peracid hydrolase